LFFVLNSLARYVDTLYQTILLYQAVKQVITSLAKTVAVRIVLYAVLDSKLTGSLVNVIDIKSLRV